MVDFISGYKELKDKVDELSEEEDFPCEYARVLSRDLNYGGDTYNFIKGAVICKKKIGAVNVGDYSCGFHHVKISEDGGLEVSCNFGENNFFLDNLKVED